MTESYSIFTGIRGRFARIRAITAFNERLIFKKRRKRLQGCNQNSTLKKSQVKGNFYLKIRGRKSPQGLELGATLWSAGSNINATHVISSKPRRALELISVGPMSCYIGNVVH